VLFLGDLMTFRKFTQGSIDNITRIKESSNWMVGIPGNGPLPRVREFLDDIGINIHGKGRRINDIGFFGVGGIQNTKETVSDIREFYRTEDTSNITPDIRTMDTLNAFGISLVNGRFEVKEWTESDFSSLDVYTSPFEHSEERMYEIASTAYSQIKDSSIQILLSHVPPYEPGIISAFPIGVSTGSKGIRKFLEGTPLAVSISGHYHKHHEFKVGNTDCVVIPAAMNGSYGVLSTDASTKKPSIQICKF